MRIVFRSLLVLMLIASCSRSSENAQDVDAEKLTQKKTEVEVDPRVSWLNNLNVPISIELYIAPGSPINRALIADLAKLSDFGFANPQIDLRTHAQFIGNKPEVLIAIMLVDCIENRLDIPWIDATIFVNQSYESYREFGSELGATLANSITSEFKLDGKEFIRTCVSDENLLAEKKDVANSFYENRDLSRYYSLPVLSLKFAEKLIAVSGAPKSFLYTDPFDQGRYILRLNAELPLEISDAYKINMGDGSAIPVLAIIRENTDGTYSFDINHPNEKLRTSFAVPVSDVPKEDARAYLESYAVSYSATRIIGSLFSDPIEFLFIHSLGESTLMCERGDILACDDLGSLYFAGQAAPKNTRYALSLFAKACDGGNLSSCLRLGSLYSGDAGVEQDLALATEFFGKACKLGSVEACNHQ